MSDGPNEVSIPLQVHDHAIYWKESTWIGLVNVRLNTYRCLMSDHDHMCLPFQIK